MNLKANSTTTASPTQAAKYCEILEKWLEEND